jgi:hypothetical protein
VLNQAKGAQIREVFIWVRSLNLIYIKASSPGEGSTSHNNTRRLVRTLQSNNPNRYRNISGPVVSGLDIRQAQGCIYDIEQIEAPISHVRLISARIRTLAIYTIYRWRYRCGHRLRDTVMYSHLPPVQKPYMVLHSLRCWSPGQSQPCRVAFPN